MGFSALTTLIYGIELNCNDIRKIGKHFNLSDLSKMREIFNEIPSAGIEHVDTFKDIAYGKDARFYITTLVDWGECIRC